MTFDSLSCVSAWAESSGKERAGQLGGGMRAPGWASPQRPAKLEKNLLRSQERTAEVKAAVGWPVCSRRFAEHTSQMYWFQWDSESCSGSDRQQRTKYIFWCKFDFAKCFGAPVSLTTELVVTICHIKSTFLYTLNPTEKWFVVIV